MSLLGSIAKVLGLGGDTGAPVEAARLQSEAATRAAELRSQAFDRALPILQDQLDVTRQAFDPFIDASVDALPQLQEGFQTPQGTSLGGIEELINQIMGGGAFSGLVDQRTEAVQGQLAAGGLTRSGTALQEAAAIPTDLAFQIENLLTGRQFGAEQQRIQGLESLVAGGRSATGAEAGLSGNIIANIVNAITGQAGAVSQGVTDSAAATASGVLGKAQVEQAGIQNLLNLGGLVGSAFIGGSSAPSSGAPAFGSGQVTSLPSVFNSVSTSGIAGFS